MEHAGVLIHVEIEIDLHPPLMGMARHGVPDYRPVRQAHAELTGFQYIRHEIFIDGAALLVRLSPASPALHRQG